MAAKNAHEAAKAKAAKQKKLLVAMSPLLAVAIFFAYHTMSKLHQSSGATPPAATPPTTTLSTGTPVSATTPLTAISTPADSGKLSRLTLFAPKDPFHDQGPHASASAGAGGTAKKSASKSKPAKQTPAAPPTTAVISVNGKLAAVTIGDIFPATKDPATNGIFRLVGLTAKSAKIAVAGGSYANGARTLTLTVNSVVTLVNTADGKRYKLVLYPQGTPAPGAPLLTTTPTTTTPGP